MLKVVTHDENDVATLFLGLTRGNLDKLPKNEPILVDLAELGYARGVQKVVILAGETQDEVLDDLRSIGLPIPKDVKGIPE